MIRETDKELLAHKKCELIEKTDGNNIEGKKVVATVPIKKGEIVCYVCGTIYSDEDKHTPTGGRIGNNWENDLFSFDYDEKNGLYVDPGKIHDPTNRNSKHISGFINHSCDPNCEVRDSKKGKVIVAIRNIREDEEITIYYGDDWFKLRGIYCQCGKSNCKFSKERALTNKENEYANEGERIERIINISKRNRKLRDKVIKKSKGTCQVCGRQLKDIYGGFGDGVLEVHHQTPLAARKGRPSKTHIKDLIAVCPNCHAVLHKMEKHPSVKTTKRLRRIIKLRQEENEEE